MVVDDTHTTEGEFPPLPDSDSESESTYSDDDLPPLVNSEETTTQDPCPDCGHVHPSSEDVIDMLFSGPNYTVPDEHKTPRPQNDEFWDKFGIGPDKVDFDVGDNIDDVVTAYTREWFAAAQAFTNMTMILSKVVKKYSIVNSDIHPDLPQGINQIFSTGNSVLDAEKVLYKRKDLLFRLLNIRKGWGSIDAYANAPESERTAWNEANSSNEGLAMLMALLQSGPGSEQDLTTLAHML